MRERSQPAGTPNRAIQTARPDRRDIPSALLIVAVLLGGCSGNESLDDLRAFTEEAYRDQKPSIEPLPVIKPYDTFEYTASGMVDPFSPTNLIDPEEQRASGPSPDRTRRREALEQFPLDALKMVGTMFQSDDSWVIVRAPDGTVHRVTVGNYLGQNNGRITYISEERVDIREIVQGPTGNWEERMVTVSLVQG